MHAKALQRNATNHPAHQRDTKGCMKIDIEATAEELDEMGEAIVGQLPHLISDALDRQLSLPGYNVTVNAHAKKRLEFEVSVGGQVCKPYTVTDAEEHLSRFGLTGYEHAKGKLTLVNQHMSDYPTLLEAEDGMVADTMRMVFTTGNNRKAGAARAQKNLANAIRLAECWNAFDGVPTIEIGRFIGELRSQIIGERTNHAAELEKADAHYDAKHDAMADTLAQLAAAQAINAQLVEALTIIKAGHGCPAALAADALTAAGAA